MADLLLVDDDLDVSWILQQLLEERGHSVRVARDGQEGLARLAEHRPDLIILDVEMPMLNGPGMAYRMFVHDAGLENIPIVLVSGCRSLPAVARRVGTPYYLAKPFDVGALLSLLEQALTERAIPRPAR